MLSCPGHFTLNIDNSENVQHAADAPRCPVG